MQRNPNESFADYKKRRLKENKRIKQQLKGFWFYQNAPIPYVRPKKTRPLMLNEKQQ